MRNFMALACAGTLIWSGAAAAITLEGLSSLQVVQVGDDGIATVQLSGKAESSAVEAHVEDTRQIGLTTPWQPLGNVDHGKYAGELQLKAGGPYRVTVRAEHASGDEGEETSVEGVLAGDLWVMAGQSNMQGVGNIDGSQVPPQADVHLLRMNHAWSLAAEPLHILPESPDKVHGEFANDTDRANAVAGAYAAKKGAGLGLGFARAMAHATGRPVGLIATAHGGTSLEQWNPNQKDKGGDSLYGSMLAQVKAAGGKVRGVLWYQGESDCSPTDGPTYGDRFKTLIAEMRKDFGGEKMPFYYVQLGRFVIPGIDHASWNKVRGEQLRVELEIAPGGLVPALDYDLDDLIHVGTAGLIGLGERMAHLAQHDLFGGSVDIGPRLASTSKFMNDFGGGIRVKFNHVNGALAAPGRVSGFAISDGPDGALSDCIYKQQIDPADSASVLLYIQPEFLVANAHLWYGWGANPYCNITDAAGMGMPAFGPIPVPADVIDAFVKK